MPNSEMIAAEVLRIPTGIGNSYVLGTADKWVLVDTGTQGNAKNILNAVEEHLGADAVPAAIVLTHGHFDHAGSARELSDHWEVDIYAHRLEIPFINGTDSYPPPDPTVGGFMANMMRLFPNWKTTKVNVGQNLRVLSSDKLPWLPEWEIIETPGHAPGHVSFYRRSDSVLIVGDAFCTVNQYSMSDTLSQRQQVSSPPPYFTIDWQAAERSVKKLAELRPKVLAAGHGIPMRGASATTQLREMANNFPVPEKGRYVGSPVRTNESGVVYLPPPPADPVKIGLLAGLGAAGVIAAVLVARNRSRSFAERGDMARAA